MFFVQLSFNVELRVQRFHKARSQIKYLQISCGSVGDELQQWLNPTEHLQQQAIDLLNF